MIIIFSIRNPFFMMNSIKLIRWREHIESKTIKISQTNEHLTEINGPKWLKISVNLLQTLNDPDHDTLFHVSCIKRKRICFFLSYFFPGPHTEFYCNRIWLCSICAFTRNQIKVKRDTAEANTEAETATAK